MRVREKNENVFETKNQNVNSEVMTIVRGRCSSWGGMGTGARDGADGRSKGTLRHLARNVEEDGGVHGGPELRPSVD